MYLILLLLKPVAECPIAFNWSRIESSLLQKDILNSQYFLISVLKHFHLLNFQFCFKPGAIWLKLMYFLDVCFLSLLQNVFLYSQIGNNVFVTVTSLDGFSIIFENKRGVCDKMLFLWSGLSRFKERDVSLLQSGVFETDI